MTSDRGQPHRRFGLVALRKSDCSVTVGLIIAMTDSEMLVPADGWCDSVAAPNLGVTSGGLRGDTTSQLASSILHNDFGGLKDCEVRRTLLITAQRVERCVDCAPAGAVSNATETAMDSVTQKADFPG